MTVPGFDISHHQGQVNFGAAKRGGQGFVVIKATEGVGFIDPSFAGNRTAAHAAGLRVGLYHFARAGDPLAEAAYFCRVVGALIPGEFVVLDWEVQASNPPAWCKTWLDKVAAVLGARPLIYMNQSTRDSHDWTRVVGGGYPLWLAKYDNSPARSTSGDWPSLSMKQYSSSGSVPGVAGPVDVDVFYGDAAALAALGTPTPGDDMTDAERAQLQRIEDILMRKQNGGVQDVLNTANATLNAVRALADPATIAAELVKLLPVGSGGGLSEADVEAALRKVLGSLATPA